jgi:hypothetical protein
VAISSQGTTFAFQDAGGTFTAKVLSISVEEATPEIVDMTQVGDPLGGRKMVATGDILSPAKVTIEYLRDSTEIARATPLSTFGAGLAGQVGTLTIANSAAFVVQSEAVLESAGTELAAGDFMRGRMTFVMNNIPY